MQRTSYSKYTVFEIIVMFICIVYTNKISDKLLR